MDEEQIEKWLKELQWETRVLENIIREKHKLLENIKKRVVILKEQAKTIKTEEITSDDKQCD